MPDELVSPAIAKYAVSEDGDAADVEAVKQKPRRYTVSRERMYPGAKSKRAKGRGSKREANHAPIARIPC